MQVKFGDPKMDIKRDDPERRRNLEQDTTAIIQVLNIKQDTGLVRCGVLRMYLI